EARIYAEGRILLEDGLRAVAHDDEAAARRERADASLERLGGGDQVEGRVHALTRRLREGLLREVATARVDDRVGAHRLHHLELVVGDVRAQDLAAAQLRYLHGVDPDAAAGADDEHAV